MSGCPKVTLWSCPNQIPSGGPCTTQAGMAENWIPEWEEAPLWRSLLPTAACLSHLLALLPPRRTTLSSEAHPPAEGSLHPFKAFLNSDEHKFWSMLLGNQLLTVGKPIKASNFSVPDADNTPLPSTILHPPEARTQGTLSPF